jgi:hypothetical protein
MSYLSVPHCLYMLAGVKVFISHSSLDKYIAGTISEELERRGIETFLDAKDIETGDSLDDSIDGQLKDCDELLILLSPVALKSHWVLLEVGGAKALKKRLVPILIHVGPNELPAPLAKGFARDLNEIDKYFDEVQARALASPASDAEPPADSYVAFGPDDLVDEFSDTNVDMPTDEEIRTAERAEAESRARRTFKVSDIVRIPERPQETFVSPLDMAIRWTDDMTQHAGKTATVTQVDPDRTVQLDVDRVKWWAMDWLEPVTF